MLVWSQSKGELTRFGSDTVIGKGYSGAAQGRNNPALQDVPQTGPVPRGFWRLGAAYTSAKTGPMTIPLYKLDDTPGDDTDAQTGRSSFRIHGDNATGTASEGCVILPRIIREMIAAGKDEILWVVS